MPWRVAPNMILLGPTRDATINTLAREQHSSIWAIHYIRPPSDSWCCLPVWSISLPELPPARAPLPPRIRAPARQDASTRQHIRCRRRVPRQAPGAVPTTAPGKMSKQKPPAGEEADPYDVGEEEEEEEEQWNRNTRREFRLVHCIRRARGTRPSRCSHPLHRRHEKASSSGEH